MRQIIDPHCSSCGSVHQDDIDIDRSEDGLSFCCSSEVVSPIECSEDSCSHS